MCDIHYRQMEKPDRDADQAMRADEECRQLLIQFPNSKFAPAAQQKLRNIQEVLAESEYRVGSFYYSKGALVSAANRLQGLTDHYPLFSRADEALWKLGDSYSARMADGSRLRRPRHYARIVRDYPLSPYVEQAKKRLAASGTAHPRARSGRRWPHEVRAGEPGQARHHEPFLGGLPQGAGRLRGGEVGYAGDVGPATDHSGHAFPASSRPARRSART